MTLATSTWQELFLEHRHAQLGCLARSRRNSEVRSLADDEILLLGGASSAARLSQRPKAKVGGEPLSLALTPEGAGQTLEEFQSLLPELRCAHPQAELAGFGPLDSAVVDRLRGLDRGVVLAGRLEERFLPSSEFAEFHRLAMPLTAVLVVTPATTVEAIEQASEALSELLTLVSVVPLPAGAGDRIPLPGLTTAGSLDAMVISALRLTLPREVRVRASWAALGWKVAQVALAYGADEIAGWTAAETLAYTGRVRAAGRVERAELDVGLEEARCRDLAWPRHSSGES